MTKTCLGCRQDLDTSDFYVASRKTGKLHSRCKPCYAVQQYERRRKLLKPCSLCGGPKDRALERARLCSQCQPWALYAGNLRRAGLTPADYLAILAAQGGGCAICGVVPDGRRFPIDHDHQLPRGRASVRGIICDFCNHRRLPIFGDEIVLLAMAIRYLMHPPAQRVLRNRDRSKALPQQGDSPSGTSDQSEATVRTVRRSTRMSR